MPYLLIVNSCPKMLCLFVANVVYNKKIGCARHASKEEKSAFKFAKIQLLCEEAVHHRANKAKCACNFPMNILFFQTQRSILSFS